ncbi:PREDICTED: uncharacterized protein LOC105959845 [Erythranthe guttata]|uniref:uncharacterized protein LOC105959845 n=1 Tax=Erythranthe guttata TaxID=4155 RepID=UPI00064E05AC|nr:PREDICTED: uncharacterized protein LOC105959845 [Erythranthe guttata]|eukprot:XP_012839461.1 PREDICTED: uncharacterized protein LOC105959845 [Erythranthe guttata]
MASEKNDKRKRTQAAVKNATARNKLPTTRKAKEKIMQENEPTRKERGKGKEPMMSVITKARNQQIDGSSPSQNLRPRNKKGLVTRSQQAHVARNKQSQPKLGTEECDSRMKSVRRRLIDEDD